MNLSSKNARLLLMAGIALVLVSAGLLLGYFLIPERPQSPISPPLTAAPQPLREVILYFAAADGTHLIAEQRELQGCQDDQSCLAATLQALLEGPAGAGARLLPAQTLLRGITLGDQGLATVNFSSDLVAGHPGGSMSELLTVYGVADTLAVNFPYLRQVRFMVEGEPLATLKGHVDLRQPLVPDFSLTRPPPEGRASSPAPTRKDP